MSPSPVAVTVVVLAACVASALHALSIACPFQQALDDGQLTGATIEQHKALLIRSRNVQTAGHPAHLVWSVGALDATTVDQFARATNLLLAKQLFAQQQQMLRPAENLSATVAVRQMLSQQVACMPLAVRCVPAPQCAANGIFVQTGGFCNNLRMPRWGAARSPYGRLLSPAYDDAIYTFRRSVSNAPLPSPRLIGNHLASLDVFAAESVESSEPAGRPNFGAVIFGQFVAHDTGLRDVYQNINGGAGLSCCPHDQSFMPSAATTYHGCQPIEIPADDPFYSEVGGRRQCMSFVRSQPAMANDCTMDTTEFSNAVSHFLDLSTIYGSNAASARSVRLFTGGRLLIANGIAARRPDCTSLFCYFTGDPRAMVAPPLALWHAVFIRFHNHLAERLAVQMPRSGDELLFQEARRLVTAIYQHVIVDEWLPLFVGREAAERRAVSCPLGAESLCRGRYDPTLDPSTLNEFAHAAFRVFHVHIPGQMNLYDANFNRYFTARLNDTFRGASLLETDFSGVLRGMLVDPMAVGSYPQHIRNTIFNNDHPQGIGLDLLAVDIARGRDHGLRPYVDYLQLGLIQTQPITDWSQIAALFSADSLAALQRVYGDVRDVDAVVGMLLEQRTDGASFAGPVGQFIVEEQFRRFKFGDRFFYSLVDQPHAFADGEVREIQAQSMASVLCAVTDVDAVLLHAFEVESERNPLVRCASLRQMKLVM